MAGKFLNLARKCLTGEFLKEKPFLVGASWNKFRDIALTCFEDFSSFESIHSTFPGTFKKIQERFSSVMVTLSCFGSEQYLEISKLTGSDTKKIDIKTVTPFMIYSNFRVLPMGQMAQNITGETPCLEDFALLTKFLR